MLDKKVLVIYDISNNKRRRKVNKILKFYGVRIQGSAFECLISPFSIETMKQKLIKQIDEKKDKLKIYVLNSQNLIFSFGNSPEIIENQLFDFV